MSATGPVSVAELGPTLMHEHIYVNLMREFRGTGLLNDEQEAEAELIAFAKLGGGTILDLTPVELSVGAAPDPGDWRSLDRSIPDLTPLSRSAGNVKALRDLSTRTGVRIILGTGHYRDPYLAGTAVETADPAQVADHMVRDIEEGFSGTEVRAGIIGEVGAERWFISALEERSLRAAAMAHRRTSLPISTHAARWPNGLLQLELLGELGVPPEAVIIGHCDSVNIPEYHLELARRGAYVQFDTFRMSAGPHFERRVGFIQNLIRQGFGEQILLSHDVCETTHLRSNGGGGFTVILTALQQRMEALGLQSVYEDLIVHNPRRALGGE
ncbi:phosphotriesterase family protein [Pseudactinotalea sp. Z1748]|uniref:phosphotriesterase family protein n=1 Tax=Pseudactinotalea sp. Z1748 TaxID=3413027 RepID=UPI003C7DB84A